MAATTRTKTSEDALVITRNFDAPRERVWKAWVNPEQAKKWWGPKDFTAPAFETDPRVGGKYLACMRGPDGKDYWSTGVYREVVPNEKLVMTDSFADAKGNRIPASEYGMSGDWPAELLVTVTLDENNGKTKLTLQHEGLPEEAREMCAQGWNESLDKLENSLK